jgi:hypothetical protein
MEISQGNSLCSCLYLKQAKMSFFFLFFSYLFSSTKSGNKTVEQVLLQGSGGWEHQWKVEGGGENGVGG